jgi:hypothetical protein
LRRNKSSHIALAIYAIVSKFPPAKFMELVGYVSQIIGPINLLLAIVTGSVRGKEHVDQPAAAAPGVDRISVARAGAAPVTQTDNFWQVLFFVIGGIVLIVNFRWPTGCYPQSAPRGDLFAAPEYEFRE